MVRSEIDACIPPTESPFEGAFTSPIDNETAQILSSHFNDDPIHTPYGLTIIPSPNPPTPQTSLIELSTIKVSKKPTGLWLAEERYPQLFLSQVPNHYLAYHAQGTITSIHKRNLHSSPEIRNSADQMKVKLNQLRELLVSVQSAVLAQVYRSGKRRCFSLVYVKGELALYERVGERCLPTEVLAMFDI